MSGIFSHAAVQEKAHFNLVTQTSSFNSVFNTQPLDSVDGAKIEELLLEGDFVTQKRAMRDAAELKVLTAEIRSIGRQGVILTGERVSKAREIFKAYRDGSFTRWLELTFGAKKTGYNMLAYFELYQALGDQELQERFKQLPQKAAYILASREGELEKKRELVREAHTLSLKEIVVLIQRAFPSRAEDKRRRGVSNVQVIDSVRIALGKLDRRTLTKSQRQELLALSQQICFICK